ncbi:hypothetical protein psal_cds_676 [Pandoravirus salinus]|uniref:Uncharacterized protein n=1 Tax=Pandoravirus salinus TaxID=1349410 RepID=S4VYQ5_9VIRU|nr:hypothetical protein psal_cds_676 [Pandoravirus salinus]AGO84606.1 hypothetical protein psal_cds_676 [Pandoravirus salinus]
MKSGVCVASVGLLVLLALASVESQAVYGGALRLYNDAAMSYCFADDRMSGAPLTCVAVPYLKDAHMFALGGADGNNGTRVTLPTLCTTLTIIDAPTTAATTRTSVPLRSCRPDPVTRRVMCPVADGHGEHNDDGATRWFGLVRVAAEGDGGIDSLHSGDLVRMRSLSGARGGTDCGLIDNVVTCDGAVPSTFRIIV